MHATPSDCPDALGIDRAKFDEYGLLVHDGGSSSVAIAWCPWCGAKLPDSLRDRWFAELAALGFDDPLVQDIPARFRSGEWHST